MKAHTVKRLVKKRAANSHKRGQLPLKAMKRYNEIMRQSLAWAVRDMPYGSHTSLTCVRR